MEMARAGIDWPLRMQGLQVEATLAFDITPYPEGSVRLAIQKALCRPFASCSRSESSASSRLPKALDVEAFRVFRHEASIPGAITAQNTPVIATTEALKR